MTDRKSSTCFSRPKALRPVIETLEGRALLSTAGTPDSTYGTEGLASVQFTSSPPADSHVSSEALQADGKVVAVGGNLSFTTGSNEAAVERLDSDGSPDPTFGTGGFVILQDLPTKADSSNGIALAIQADGKIVVASDVFDPGTAGHLIDLERLNTDGSVDTTFGNAGYVEFDFNVGTTALSSAPTILAIQADGKIVVGGKAPDNLNQQPTAALARFNVDGSPDSTFGIAGQVLLIQDVPPTFQGGDGVSGLVIQPDGAIVYDTTIGEPGELYTPKAVVGRLTPSGSLDPSFGVGGEVMLGGSAVATLNGLAIQPDGKLIAVGDDELLGDLLDVFRLDVDGSLDPTFGTGGESNTTGGSNFASRSYPVLIQPDGKIVLGATQSSNANASTLVRLNSDGSLDITFGLGGIDDLPTSITGDYSEGVSALAIQADGKILAATSQGVVRLRTSGAVNDFDDDGTTDLAVLLTNFAYPIFAYHPSGAADGSPDALTAYGIPGAGQTLPGPRRLRWRRRSTSWASTSPRSAPSPIGAPVGRHLHHGAGDYIDYINTFGIPQHAIPAPADYTGSGYTEIGVYNPGLRRLHLLARKPHPSPTSRPSDTLEGRDGPSSASRGPATVDPGARRLLRHRTATTSPSTSPPVRASGPSRTPPERPSGEVDRLRASPGDRSVAIPVTRPTTTTPDISSWAVYLPASIGAFAYRYLITAAPTSHHRLRHARRRATRSPCRATTTTPATPNWPSTCPAARDAFAYRPYDGGPDVIRGLRLAGSGRLDPLQRRRGAVRSPAEGAGGGSGSPKVVMASTPAGGLDGYVDFVPDLAGQTKKKEAGSAIQAQF